MAGTVTANNIQTVNGVNAPCLYRAQGNSTTNKLSIINQVPYNTWCGQTMMCWIKPTASVQWSCYAAMHSGTTSYLVEIRQYSNSAYYGIVTRSSGTTDDLTCNNTMPFSANTWVHICVVCDGLLMRIYYNGQEKFLRFNITNPLSTAKQIDILGGAFSADNTAATYITDFRLYSDALSSKDIYNIYKAGPKTVL